jgi:amylo-alpha-1,6-glucosidase
VTAESPPSPPAEIVLRTRGDPSTPLLVTGLASAGILSADGEMRAARETRGGLVEWGGAYAQGVRLTGPWTIRAEVDGREFDLPNSLTELSARRWRVDTSHAWGGVRVRQQILPLPFDAAVDRSIELSSTEPHRVRLVQRIQPFLAPVLVEGIKPYTYRVSRWGAGLEARAFGCAVVLAPSTPATAWGLDGRPWSGEEHNGEVGEIEIVHDLKLDSSPLTISIRAWGGLAATLDSGPDLGSLAAPGGQTWTTCADGAWSSWTAGTPSMELADEPALALAYDLARGAIRTLYSKPNDEMTGLVAGFPWYSTVWCRDLAWMLPAVMWLGDTRWAEASLRTAFRFQATSRIPLLGAETGEIPMQVSPGPVFMFGTSDTTLYYPDLVRRLLDHGAPLATAADLWPQLRAAADWARAKIDPASGLLTNGGEVQEIRNAAARIGSVHFGFDALDTTIWDSTDRRDHAIDIQVLGLRAFHALVELGNRIGRPEHSHDDSAVAASLASCVGTRYVWSEERYLYDSLRRDGTAVAKVRPNALLAVSEGLLGLEAGCAAVARAGNDDLAAPWGMRTLSTRDPSFDPTAYHDGQVWTIATAWAADAAFAVGDVATGVRFLWTIAERILAEDGLANECYRGDRPEPFDSCFLLGFSVGPFLTVLFERLWGLSVRSDLRTLKVRPAFPGAWKSARLRHLAVAGGFVDLDWAPERLGVVWSGPGPLRVQFKEAILDLRSPGGATIAGAGP